MNSKPYRSLLFVPASSIDKVASAHTRGADAVILDLEDGVAAKDKPAARTALNGLLDVLQKNGVQTLLRINGLGGSGQLDGGGKLDIAALDPAFAPPLLVPKVTDPEQLVAVEECWTASGKPLAALQLLPMIECPAGLFAMQKIAASSKSISAMVFGSEDFANAAGTSTDIDALAMPAQWVALAAAAKGVPAYGLPGSLANYHDLERFELTAQRAKTIGFTGSLCIHPRQVAIANAVFAPSEQEIEWAEAVVAQAGDGGATGGDVGMVDEPVLARAKSILARR